MPKHPNTNTAYVKLTLPDLSVMSDAEKNFTEVFVTVRLMKLHLDRTNRILYFQKISSESTEPFFTEKKKCPQSGKET